jgi:hypothetical protein
MKFPTTNGGSIALGGRNDGVNHFSCTSTSSPSLFITSVKPQSSPLNRHLFVQPLYYWLYADLPCAMRLLRNVWGTACPSAGSCALRGWRSSSRTAQLRGRNNYIFSGALASLDLSCGREGLVTKSRADKARPKLKVIAPRTLGKHLFFGKIRLDTVHTTLCTWLSQPDIGKKSRKSRRPRKRGRAVSITPALEDIKNISGIPFTFLAASPFSRQRP